MPEQKFKVHINLEGNMIQNVVVDNVGALPAGIAGQIAYLTTDNTFYYYNGTIWVAGTDTTVASGTTALSVVESPANTFTLSIANANGTDAGLLTAAFYTLLNNAAYINTASTLALRNASGNIQVGTPTDPNDATPKTYVDNLLNGLFWKAPVRAVSTSGPVTLSGPQTVDGINLVAGDTVLLLDQGGIGSPTPNIGNGVYTVAAGAWPRRSDFGTGIDVSSFAAFAQQGTTYADTSWVCTNDTGSGIVGTDALGFVQFSNVAPGVYTAGNGLDLTGFDFSIEQANATEAKAGSLTSKVVTPASIVDVLFTYNNTFIIGDWVGAGPYTLTYTSGTTTILRPKTVTVKDSTGDIVTVAVNVTGGTVVLTSNSTFPGSVDIDGPGN